MNLEHQSIVPSTNIGIIRIIRIIRILANLWKHVVENILELQRTTKQIAFR